MLSYLQYFIKISNQSIPRASFLQANGRTGRRLSKILQWHASLPHLRSRLPGEDTQREPLQVIMGRNEWLRSCRSVPGRECLGQGDETGHISECGIAQCLPATGLGAERNTAFSSCYTLLQHVSLPTFPPQKGLVCNCLSLFFIRLLCLALRLRVQRRMKGVSRHAA